MQIFLNQLVYFGFFQSLFILIIYVFSKSKRQSINGYMAFLIMTLFLGLTGKVLYNVGVWDQNFRLISLSEISALLFGPSIYLFLRSTVLKEKYEPKDLVHYVPALFYCVFILIYFVLPSDDVIRSRMPDGELMRVIYMCHAIGLIVNISYWVLSWKVFADFIQKTKDELSYSIRVHFIKYFLILVCVCLIVWSALLVISILNFDMLERNIRPYMWILLTFLILFITYYTMVNPKVLQVISETNLKKYSQSKLNIKQLEQLKLDLEKLMINKKPYLNQKLLKAELAEMLGISNPELARLLNENIGMNFFEYINYYRIKEFINLAKSDKAKQLTFFGLAQEAGFNSKTTFNKSFKNLMGTSPRDYFNQN